MVTQERYHGLDFVRAMAMMLGLSVHVNIFYFTEDRIFWSAGEYHGDPINQFIAFFIFQFRMPLFYMLAGFFALLVIERKGLGFIIRDRLKRIGVPFILGVVFLAPVLASLWCVNTSYENYFVGMGLWERFIHIIFWGKFSDRDIPFQIPLIHYWFIYFLLIFYIVHFLFRFLRLRLMGRFKPNIHPLFRFFITKRVGLFLLPLLFFPLRYSLKNPGIGLNQVDFEVNSLLLYGSYYLFGVLLYQNRGCLKDIAGNCWFYAVVAIPLFVYIVEPAWRVEVSPSVVWDITNWKLSGFAIWAEGIFHSGWFKVLVCYLKDLSCFALCFSFIGLAHRFISQGNEYVRYLADSSYWAYWVHILPTFVISSYLQQFESLNSLTKAYIAFVVSVFIVYWTYNTFVRYSFLGDYFMSKRKNRADELDGKFTTFNLVKLTMKPVLCVGLGVLALGSLLHQDSLTQKGHLIVESYVARNKPLLESTESFDHIYDISGNTPLHVAVKMNEKWRRYDTVPILISKTTDLNVRNSNGRTSLFQAVRNGNIEDAKKLIAAGANVNLSDKYGHTPAHVAAVKSGLTDRNRADHFFKLLTLLKESGTDLSMKDYLGRTVEDCLKTFRNKAVK